MLTGFSALYLAEWFLHITKMSVLFVYGVVQLQRSIQNECCYSSGVQLVITTMCCKIYGFVSLTYVAVNAV
jgi:hypothetical protein